MRLLQRLRDHVPRRNRQVLPFVGERRLGPVSRNQTKRFVDLLSRLLAIDAESLPFALDRSSQPELDTPAADDVEEGRTLGNLERMVDAEGGEGSGRPQTDPLGVLREHRQEHVGRRAMAELARAVMFDAPPAAIPHRVGEPRLLDGLGVEPGLCHAARFLQFGEDVENHEVLTLPFGGVGTVGVPERVRLRTRLDRSGRCRSPR